MSDDEEAIVRSMGALRINIELNYPELHRAKLSAEILLSYHSPEEPRNIVYVKLGDDFTEAWLTDSKDDPVRTGEFLGRVSYAFRPVADKPFIDFGSEKHPREVESIINSAIAGSKKEGKL